MVIENILKMKINWLLFVIVIVSLTSSCQMDDENSAELNINFKLKYGSQNLEMFKEYNYPQSGEKLIFTRVSFYISEITLKSEIGDYLIKDIDYLSVV